MRGRILAMCRMLVAPRGLPGHAVLDPFRAMARGRNSRREHDHGWDHPDGWGIVYEEKGRLRAYRSAQPCWEDSTLDAFRGARVFLLHARRATNGTVSAENAHPFCREVRGRTWFFSHNGTVHDPLVVPDGEGHAATTDSHRLFLRLAAEDLSGDPAAALRSVYGSLARYTSLNTFLLEQKELWAVCRWAKDEAYYTLHVGEVGEGPVVSSEPLPELSAAWTRIPNGSLLRVDRSTEAIEHTVLVTA
ncbi:MAG: class II glutamine amidotransferase [Candidatus Bipolaricaulis sp.]|nr:class II glutamine amidotransferase [Candidatus Bipolaricaulis sp.]